MKLKASEIIEQSCCSQGLPPDCQKPKLFKMVKKIEDDNKRLISQIKKLESEENTMLLIIFVAYFILELLRVWGF